jgi:hypothetical protein
MSTLQNNENSPLLGSESEESGTSYSSDEHTEDTKMTNEKEEEEEEEARGIFALHSANESQSESVENNWTKDNKDTLTNWANSLSQASFVYQYAKDKKKNKLTKISLGSFIITGIATLFAGVSSLALTSEDDPYPTIALAFSVTVFCLNSSATVINGIITKIYKLDHTVESYTKYIERIDILYAKLSIQNDLSPDLRKEANQYILKQSNKYSELIQKCPDIEPKLYEEASKEYQKFRENNI